MPTASQNIVTELGLNDCMPTGYALSIGISSNTPQDTYTCTLIRHKRDAAHPEQPGRHDRVALTYFWGVADITHDVDDYFSPCSDSSAPDCLEGKMPTVLTLRGSVEIVFKKSKEYAETDPCGKNKTFRIMVSSPHAQNSAVTAMF